MTYDVYFRRAQELGDDPLAAFEADLDDEDAADLDAEPQPPGPELRAQLDALVEALVESNPRFERLGSFAESSFVQLDDEHPGGVLVNLDSGELSAQISYGTNDAEAAARNLADCVRVLAACGYVAYDPQLERIVTGDAADVRDTAAIVQEIHDDLTRRYPRGRGSGLFRRLLGR